MSDKFTSLFFGFSNFIKSSEFLCCSSFVLCYFKNSFEESNGEVACGVS